MLTTGISAEYGRFSGGVDQRRHQARRERVLGQPARSTSPTRTGRTRASSSRSASTPARRGPCRTSTRRTRSTSSRSGGPILKDRLWFFAAHRRENSSDPKTLSNTGIAYNLEVENPRYEGKLTGSPRTNHTLHRVVHPQRDRAAQPGLDQRDREHRPRHAGEPHAAQRPVRGELQRRPQLEPVRGGAVLAEDAGLPGHGRNQHRHPRLAVHVPGAAPACPPAATSTRRTSTPTTPRTATTASTPLRCRTSCPPAAAGRHDLKVGGEHFTSWRTGGNSQSSTGFVFFGDPVMSGGAPVIDSGGRLIPTFVPGQNRIQNWIPVRGAQINLHTLSLYLNDRWTLNEHAELQPRGALRAAHRRHHAGGHRHAEQQRGRAAPGRELRPQGRRAVGAAGELRRLRGQGRGDAVRRQHQRGLAEPASTCATTAPPARASTSRPASTSPTTPSFNGSFPVRNVFLDEGLETPSTREFTLQAGTRLGPARRGQGDLHQPPDGHPAGRLHHPRDRPDDGDRGRPDLRPLRQRVHHQHRHLVPQVRRHAADSSYRVSAKLSVWAHYTMQLKNEGNFEGEAANQPGNYSIIGDRPEILSEAATLPGRPPGPVPAAQGARGGQPRPAAGPRRHGQPGPAVPLRLAADLQLLAAACPPPRRSGRWPRPRATRASSASQTIFYEGRGTQEYEAQHLVDLALNYDVPVWKKVRPYVKFDLRNVFNSQPLIGFDTTLIPNNSGPHGRARHPHDLHPGAELRQEHRAARTTRCRASTASRSASGSSSGS